MPRHSTPGPQSPIRHGDNNGQASLEEHPSGYAVEARRYSFFVFPPEIRNMIYRLSLKQPSCADLFRNYRHSVATRPEGQRWTRTHLETPTILLLCKRITDESIPVLRAMSFIVDRLPPCMPPLPDGRGGFLRMINFIGRETLQQLKFIDIRIGLGDGSLGSGWIWNRVFDEVLLILSEKNSLVHLRVLIRRCNEEENLSIWDAELTEERSIRKKIKWFQLTNPNIFRPCDITVETWRIDGQEATFLDCIDKWDQVKHPEQLCRSYPDPELFPGSIMQFVDALREADGSGGEG